MSGLSFNQHAAPCKMPPSCPLCGTVAAVAVATVTVSYTTFGTVRTACYMGAIVQLIERRTAIAQLVQRQTATAQLVQRRTAIAQLVPSRQQIRSDPLPPICDYCTDYTFAALPGESM